MIQRNDLVVALDTSEIEFTRSKSDREPSMSGVPLRGPGRPIAAGKDMDTIVSYGAFKTQTHTNEELPGEFLVLLKKKND